jgi:hypothetical protein
MTNELTIPKRPTISAVLLKKGWVSLEHPDECGAPGAWSSPTWLCRYRTLFPSLDGKDVTNISQDAVT